MRACESQKTTDANDDDDAHDVDVNVDVDSDGSSGSEGNVTIPFSAVRNVLNALYTHDYSMPKRVLLL